MSNPFKQALIAAALESQEDQPADASIPPQDLDAALIDVSDSVAAVNDAADDGVVLSEVQAGLEAICAAMESQTTHIDEQAAGFMFAAANAHLGRIGGDLSAAPSLESFSGKTIRAANTLSMETLKEQLAAVVEAIKRAFAKLIEHIKAFWKRATVAGERLKHRAEQLKAKLGALHNAKAKAETFEDAGLAAKLAVEGKTDGLVEQFTNVVLLIEDAATIGDNGAHNVEVNTQVSMKLSAAKTIGDINDATPLLKTLKIDNSKAMPVTKTEGDTTTHATKPLPGGYVVGIRSSKEDAKVFVEHTPAKDVSATLKTLSLHDIGTVAGGCIAIAADAEKAEAKVDAISAKFDNFASLVLKGRSEEELPADVQAGIRKGFSFVARQAQEAAQAELKIVSTVVTIGRSYLAYAEKSLAQYVGEKKEEAAPAAEEPKKDEAAAAA